MAEANYRNVGSTTDRPATEPASRTSITDPALNLVDWIALILLIVGGINWGLVGLLNLNLVASALDGNSTVERIVYVLVGLAALWSIYLAVRLGRRVS